MTTVFVMQPLVLPALLISQFMANKGNAKAEARQAYAARILEERSEIVVKFKPYTDNIRF